MLLCTYEAQRGRLLAQANEEISRDGWNWGAELPRQKLLCHGPLSCHGGTGDAQGCGGLFAGQASEEAKLYDLGG